MTRSELKRLHERLPNNYTYLAQERYRELYGEEISISLISRVKNGNRDNQRILDILFYLAEQEDARRVRNGLRAKGVRV